jgi:DNA-binding response OmpR family regulator
MSGYVDEALRRDGDAEGARHFVGKPFVDDELECRIRMLLDEGD